jgi:hypothetical protein
MAENNSEYEGNFLDCLVESFWASLPEETAESYAQCKKDTLTWVKSTVSSFVDHEINRTEEHLRNAKKMRDEHCQAGPPAADDAQPA